jgi:hypothetical protein
MSKCSAQFRVTESSGSGIMTVLGILVTLTAESSGPPRETLTRHLIVLTLAPCDTVTGRGQHDRPLRPEPPDRAGGGGGGGHRRAGLL